MASLAEMERYEERLDERLISLHKQMEKHLGEIKEIDKRIERLAEKSLKARKSLEAEEKKTTRDMGRIIELENDIATFQQRRHYLIQEEEQKFRAVFNELRAIEQQEIDEETKERMKRAAIKSGYG